MTPSPMLFDLVADLTDDPVITLSVTAGSTRLFCIAEVVIDGRILTLTGVHVQGSTANAVGAATLIAIVQAVLERMDFDGLVIEGAVRSTGANPGRRPRRRWIARRGVASAPDSQPDATDG